MKGTGRRKRGTQEGVGVLNEQGEAESESGMGCALAKLCANRRVRWRHGQNEKQTERERESV